MRTAPTTRRPVTALAAALVCVSLGPAQTLIQPSLENGAIRILGIDRAILASPDKRDDLPCTVTPAKARLGFDLQFTAGYLTNVSLHAIAGNGNGLRVLFRIKPLDGKNREFYFWDRYNVPPIKPDAEGEASIPGRYKLGPGKYQIDWLMRDQAERVCSAHWKVETSIPGLIEQRAATRDPFTVGPNEVEMFLEEPPVRRTRDPKPLHVKLLVNFTPTDPRDLRLRPYDVQNLVSILRAISREPLIGSFSLVAFNMQQERVIFEQRNAHRIDFPKLGETVEAIEGGMVDFAQLADEQSASRFLTDFFTKEMREPDQGPRPDAVIILGPKLMLEKKISKQVLLENPQVNSPVFYLIYNTDPYVYPWRDAISNVLKIYKGLEYTISLPKDFGRAMKDMLERVSGREPPARAFVDPQPSPGKVGAVQ